MAARAVTCTKVQGADRGWEGRLAPAKVYVSAG